MGSTPVLSASMPAGPRWIMQSGRKTLVRSPRRCKRSSSSSSPRTPTMWNGCDSSFLAPPPPPAASPPARAAPGAPVMPPDSTDAPFEGTWSTPPATPRLRRPSLPEVALVTILLVAGALRFVGLNWDSQTHLHPDERFLTMVETGIRIPSSIGEYFDTDRSPLNPHNAGFSFFVYGTLPVFFVRFLAESLGMTGYDQIHVLGRAASAGFDLLSVFLVYLVGSRLYRRRVGLLAAAFAATSVLLIQHAHFFIVDPFANTFILGGIYFAVRALDESRTLDYVLFGLMLGMAAASKLNAAQLAGVIVLVSVIRLSRHYEDRAAAVRFELQGVLLAAVVSMITFRVFQPYAFAGASLLSLRLNPRWLANLAELANQLRGDVG